MKKLLLLALTAMMMAGCKESGIVDPHKYTVIEMDSCEYITYHEAVGFQHKGNCKFCAERRKQELKELVEQLKDR